jgi:hypothetical protein
MIVVVTAARRQFSDAFFFFSSAPAQEMTFVAVSTKSAILSYLPTARTLHLLD